MSTTILSSKGYLAGGLALILLLFVGCTTVSTQGDKAPAGQGKPGTAVQSVDVQDNKVAIGADGSFEYVVTGSNDPFKITIELLGLEQGTFTDRIMSQKQGIREVAFSTKMLPQPTTVVELTLTSPLRAVPAYADNVLTVELKGMNDEGAPGSARVEAAKKQMGEGVMVTEERPPSVKAGNIIDVIFDKDTSTLKILADGAIEPKAAKADNILTIDIPGVKFPGVVPSVVSPLKSLKKEERSDGVNVVIEMEKNASHAFSYVGDLAIVAFTSDTIAKAAVASKGTSAKAQRKADTASSAGTGKAGASDKSTVTMPDASGGAPAPGAGNTTPAVSAGVPPSMVGLAEDSRIPEVCGEDGVIKPVSCGKSVSDQKLNLDFQNADIAPILRLLSTVSSCNIVFSPGLTGKVTMNVKDASWFQVANIILYSNRLACKQTGNILLIITQAEYLKDRKDKFELADLTRKIQQEKMNLEIPVVRIFKLKYAKAADIQAILTGVSKEKKADGTEVSVSQKAAAGTGNYLEQLTEARSATAESAGTGGLQQQLAEREKLSLEASKPRLLSSVGSAVVDSRTESLIVKDKPSVIPEIEKLINDLDQASPQVLIEARIVEITNDSALDLGIKWGAFNKSIDNLGAIGATYGGLSGNSFLPNFPTPVGQLAGGLVLGLINPQRTMGLDLRLIALQNTRQAKLLTNPKILTLDNKEATISQGTQFPYLVINQYGMGSAAFKDITVTIKVKPHITPDNTILMDLDISKLDLIGQTLIAGSNTPVTSTLTEKTSTLVRDGETLVLGGLFKKDDRVGVEGLPGLRDLPVLGWLFKSETKSNTSNEFLIFITPRIVKVRGQDE